MAKFDFDAYVSAKVDRGLVLFRLFCLFNRFCSSDTIPLMLPEKAACFIFKVQ